MSYSTVEASILAVIRTHADFDTNNVLAGSASAIKKGLARVVRVLKGGHRQEQITIASYRHIWTVNLDMYVPWKGKIDTLETDLATETQKVIDTLHQYPRLNGSAGVTRAELLNANQADPLVNRNGRYRGQRLFLEVHEIVTPTRAE